MMRNLHPHRRQRALVRRDGRGQGPVGLGHPSLLAPPRLPLRQGRLHALPPQLIESELYGHEKGSFTGADQRRKGRFDLAEGGTPLPRRRRRHPLGAAVQAAAGHRGEGLRAGRRHHAPSRPTCGSSPPPSATCWKRSPKALSARTSTIAWTCCGSYIPPLRERLEDVPLLADHLLRQIAGRREASIDPEAMEVLKRHAWPGNVRELATHAGAGLPGRRAARSPPSCLTAEMAASPRPQAAIPISPSRPPTSRPLWTRPNASCLGNALRAAGGNKTAAAAALGMKPSTFRDKLAKHGL